MPNKSLTLEEIHQLASAAGLQSVGRWKWCYFRSVNGLAVPLYGSIRYDRTFYLWAGNAWMRVEPDDQIDLWTRWPSEVSGRESRTGPEAAYDWLIERLKCPDAELLEAIKAAATLREARVVDLEDAVQDARDRSARLCTLLQSLKGSGETAEKVSGIEMKGERSGTG